MIQPYNNKTLFSIEAHRTITIQLSESVLTDALFDDRSFGNVSLSNMSPPESMTLVGLKKGRAMSADMQQDWACSASKCRLLYCGHGHRPIELI